DRFIPLARRTEQRDQIIRKHTTQDRRSDVPGHADPFGMMEEIPQFQLEPTVRYRTNNLPHRVRILRLPISREAHHLVFIAIVEKSKVLGHSQVEEPQ